MRPRGGLSLEMAPRPPGVGAGPSDRPVSGAYIPPVDQAGPVAGAAGDLHLHEVHAHGPACAAPPAGQSAASPQAAREVRRPDPVRGPPAGRPAGRRASAGLDLDHDGHRPVQADHVQLGLRRAEVAVQDQPAAITQGPAGELLADLAQPGGVHRGLSTDADLEPPARGEPDPQPLERGPEEARASRPPAAGESLGASVEASQSRISLTAARE